MLFNSLEFLIFLPIVFVIFYITPHRFRLIILLVASYFFYMSWNPWYIVLILASTLTDYLAALFIERSSQRLIRQLFLLLSLGINLGLLGTFKYGDFVIENLNLGMSYLGKDSFQALDLILPVGISFYTFQTISYTIDVYRKEVHAEKNILKFALYVCYFPQLVAGPIERYKKLSTELSKRVILNEELLRRGILLILYGFFIKMVIADNIGLIVDQSYLAENQNLIAGILLYPFQIYCDFHGYSTIAIGVACLFGVNLSPNFLGPFWSMSLTEFWRKWHITLTTWFRDYIYYPMGGNKNGFFIMVVATLIVFLISGFWHGANWTFVIWGALHGLVVVIEKIVGYHKWKTGTLVSIIRGLFNYGLVALFFVYFRANSVEQAHHVIASAKQNTFFTPEISIVFSLTFLLFLAFDFWFRNEDFEKIITRKQPYIQWVIGAVILFMTLAFSGANQQPFIYFQF